MKSITTSIYILVIVLASPIKANSQSIIGDWYAVDLDKSTIRIYQNNGTYYGKIVDSETKEYVGIVVLKKMKFNTKLNSWEGTIYSPKRKMEIDGELSLESNGKLKVVGSKYLLSKTFYWVRK